MKIIKKGKIPKPINPYKIVCENCHTEFEYEEDDIKDKLESIDRDYRNRKEKVKYVKYLECPLCKEQYNILENKFELKLNG